MAHSRYLLSYRCYKLLDNLTRLSLTIFPYFSIQTFVDLKRKYIREGNVTVLKHGKKGADNAPTLPLPPLPDTNTSNENNSTSNSNAVTPTTSNSNITVPSQSIASQNELNNGPLPVVRTTHSCLWESISFQTKYTNLFLIFIS